MAGYNKENGTYYYDNNNNNNNNNRQDDAFSYEYRMAEQAYNRNRRLAQTLRSFSGIFIFFSFFSGGFFGGVISSMLIFGGLSMLFDQRAKSLQKKMYQLRMRKNPTDVPKMNVKNDRVSSLQRESAKYMQLIRAANDAIPGVEISQDITEIEQLTHEIFDYAIKNPDKTSGLKSFFSYYLPTTLKLLNTYANLDAQPIQTEQITKTKAEIHAMLKKIKAAFAKLYDQIFDITALDVSSEITAMESMMNTQGLLNPLDNELKAAVAKAEAEEKARSQQAPQAAEIELKLPDTEETEN